MRQSLLALFLLTPFVTGIVAAEELPPVVFIPFENVPTLDPKKQAVFVPYERFMALWESSRPKPEDVVKPPVGATLRDYTLTGTVRGDLAEFKMTGTVTGLGKDWAQVLLPETLGISDFKPGDDGLIIERKANALVLHVRGVGQHSFTATVAAPVTGDVSGRRSLTLALPAAGAGRLEVLVPQADAALTLTPPVAATTTPAEGGTKLMAVLGGTPQVHIGWQPPAEVATGEALILSESETRLSIGERSLHYDVALELTILRRPMDSVQISIPADTQVLSVQGKDVRTWERTAAADGTGLLTVALHQPVQGSYPLHVRLERTLEGLAPGASRSVQVAWPSVIKVARATGRIAVVQGEGLLATMETVEGLSQIDPSNTSTGTAAVAAYRFYATPPEARLLVTRLASDVRAGVHQFVRLGHEEDLIAVAVDLDIRKAGIFTLAFDVPAKWELVDTSGLPLDDARLDKPNGEWRRLELALRGRLLGNGQMVLRFKAPASVPRDGNNIAVALTEGVQVAGSFDIAVAKLQDAKQVRGTLAISLPSSWTLNSKQRTGLTSTDVESLRREGPLAVFAKELKEDEQLSLGFTYLGTDANTQLTIAPRARELNIRQEELITVAEGHLRRLLTIRGDVRYSALPALTISAPTELDGKLLFKGTTIAEQTVVSRANGMSNWELRFQSPVTGAFQITVEDHREIAALTPGTPLPLTLAPMTVLNTTRLNYVCAVAREGTVEVTAKVNGLDLVAPTDLPAGLHVQGVVAGFQGSTSVPLSLSVVRHDLVTLADGAVTAARYVAVISEERLLRVQGELLLSTRGRPYLELRLPAGAQLLEVAIDRRQSRPSRRGDGSVVVPLGDGTGLRSQMVAFVYEQRLGDSSLGSWGSVSLTLPKLGGSTGSDTSTRPLPVGPVAVELYLPDHLLTCGWSGDLSLTKEREPLWGTLLAKFGDNRQSQTNINTEIRGDGLTVPVARNGKNHQLQRLGDGGEVSVGFVGKGLINVLALFALVAGGLAMWFVRLRNDLSAAVIITAAILVAAISAPWITVVVGFAVGVGGIFCVHAGKKLIDAYRASRRKTKVVVPGTITPDPWLEKPLPLPNSTRAAEPEQSTDSTDTKPTEPRS
jgi:hypothetical protein